MTRLTCTLYRPKVLFWLGPCCFLALGAGSEGSPPVQLGSGRSPKVRDQVPCKRGSGDPGQSPPEES